MWLMEWCYVVCTQSASEASRPSAPAPEVEPIVIRLGERSRRWRSPAERPERRGWDSNPRGGLTPPTRFPVALLKPLGHLSGFPQGIGSQSGGSASAAAGGEELAQQRRALLLPQAAGDPRAVVERAARRARRGRCRRRRPSGRRRRRRRSGCGRGRSPRRTSRRARASRRGSSPAAASRRAPRPRPGSRAARRGRSGRARSSRSLPAAASGSPSRAIDGADRDVAVLGRRPRPLDRQPHQPLVGRM